MKNLYEKFETKEAGRIRPEKPKLTASFFQSDPDEIGNLSHQFEFVTKLTIETHFFANKAQYEYAKKIAQKAVVSILYGDTVSKLDELKHAIFNDNQEYALSMIDDIKKQLLE